MNKGWFYFTIIFLWCGLLFLFNIDKKGLWSSQEARNAIAAKSIMKGTAENWIIPEIAGEKSTQKPVLFYWLVTLSCIIGDKIDGFWVRIPAVLSGMMCVMYLFFAVKKIIDARTGFFCAVILATSVKFLGMSRTSRIDIFLTLCITVALFEFYFFLQNQKVRHVVAGYFFCALGVLCKGPVGLILPALVFFIYFLAVKDVKKILVFARWEGIAVFCILTIPYYIAATYVTGGEFIGDFIIKHNIERFTGGEGVFGSRKPFWFYIPNFIAGVLPWTIFSPALFYYYKFDFMTANLVSLKSKYELKGNDCAGKNNLFTFAMLWFFAIFVFFSFSSFKRSDYILPLYPAFSVIMGVPFANRTFMDVKGKTIFKWVIVFLSAFLVLANIVFILGISNLPDFIFNLEIVKKYFNENDRVTLMSVCGFFAENKFSFLLIDILISAVFFNMIISGKSKTSNLIISVGLIISVIYFYYFAKIEPVIDSRYDLAPFAQEVKTKTGGKNVIMYHFWDHALGFYIDKIDSVYLTDELRDYAVKNPPGYFIAEQKWFDRLDPEIKSKCSIITRTPENHRKKIFLAQYDIKK